MRSNSRTADLHLPTWRLPPQRTGRVLYHATEWGAEIADANEIRGAPIQVREDLIHNRQHHGVIGTSTTRDYWFAIMYAPCVFVLDHDRIGQAFRTVPRAEGAYGEEDYRIEAEELVIADRMPLDRYCLTILLDRNVAHWQDSRTIMAHPLFGGFCIGQHG